MKKKKIKFLQIDYKQKYPFVTFLLDLMPFIIIAGIIILGISGYLNQEKFNPKTQCELGNESWIEETKYGYYCNFNNTETKCRDNLILVNQKGCYSENIYADKNNYTNYLTELVAFDDINCYRNRNLYFNNSYKFEIKPVIKKEIQTICREKSQQELNQDLCNENPNDYKICKCIEKNYWYITNEFGSFYPNEFFRKYNYPECIPKEIKEIKYNLNYSYTNFTNMPCFQFYSKAKALEDFTIRFEDYTKLNVYIGYNQCLKAIPKENRDE